MVRLLDMFNGAIIMLYPVDSEPLCPSDPNLLKTPLYIKTTSLSLSLSLSLSVSTTIYSKFEWNKHDLLKPNITLCDTI